MKVILKTVLTAAVVLAIAAPVASANFTPAGGPFTANLVAGTNAVFSGAFGLKITCTTHTTTGTIPNPASSSMTILAANNKYSNCTYTTPLGQSGNVKVTVDANWTITAAAASGGSCQGFVTVPNTAVTITFTSGPLSGTSLQVQAASVKASFTNATQILTTTGANSVPYTGSLSGTATQQESIKITSTAGLVQC